MASKVRQYFTWKGLISEEYLTVRGCQSEDSHSLRGNQAFPSSIFHLPSKFKIKLPVMKLNF